LEPVFGPTSYETVIGLEVHAQLQTRSKAFAPVTTEFGGAPNTQLTPLCIGHPGTLPVLNENHVRFTVKMGLATNCAIAPRSIFARKNYFYPDLPKGYQISQFETPICAKGWVDIELDGGLTKRIRINRIHMEEDAGKSIHDQDPYHTLIDLNRAGTPLIEIVTEPDISSPAEAYAYLTKIRQIVRYLEICDGNMEEGSLRCDANVSIRPVGAEKLGTRTEIKNLNSFRNVERAIAFEVKRQAKVLDAGGKVVQTTLLWDANKLETRELRSKEEAHDYRYFPEPDIPPVIVTEALMADIRAELPEMPEERLARYLAIGVPDFDARVLTEDKAKGDYFDTVVSGRPVTLSNLAGYEPTLGDVKMAGNLITNLVSNVLNERKLDMVDFPVPPAALRGALKLRIDGKISSNGLNDLVLLMLDDSRDAAVIATEKGLVQVSDTGFLEPLVDEVIGANPDKVAAYNSGKDGLLGFFVGNVMRASQGKANPQLVSDMVVRKLKERA